MNRYYEYRAHNIVSSYGGIGSIINTTKASLLIQPLDKWPFYRWIVDRDIEDKGDNSIHDERLVNRLRVNFKNLKYILKIPVNTVSNSGHRVDDDSRLICGEIFPHWMFCPKCQKFMAQNDWIKLHRINNIKAKFTGYCPHCKKNERMNILLEQVRFIQITECGKIRDFPWVEWFDKKAGLLECDAHELTYQLSSLADSVDSIWIRCRKCGSSHSLSGIFNVFEEESQWKTVIRSSNSVYFPAIIRSLMIPLDKNLIYSEDISESDYRRAELDYILRLARNDDHVESDILNVKTVPSNCEGIDIISVRSLAMSQVLCSYTRSSPIGVGNIFDIGRSQHVSSNEFQTEYLPGIEMYGEGFLIVINRMKILKWHDSVKENPDFVKALCKVKAGLESYDPMGETHKADVDIYCYCVLHTLSHLIIKQLEYVGGYPASSLNERIYFSGDDKVGFMVYTVAGSEGSYGGIVTAVENMTVHNLFKKAIEVGKVCSNDPVCMSDSAACFSCVLLPEVSCESFNNLLNRAILIDRQFGIINAFDKL